VDTHMHPHENKRIATLDSIVNTGASINHFHVYSSSNVTSAMTNGKVMTVCSSCVNDHDMAGKISI
jgi:hypothetical protein